MGRDGMPKGRPICRNLWPSARASSSDRRRMVDQWYDTSKTGGRVPARHLAPFRNWVTADGSAGPSGAGGFKAEAGRYHLYVSHACPWAHRALIFRALKGLDDLIDVSVVHPDMLGDGWSFSTDFPGATGDKLFGSDHHPRHLHPCRPERVGPRHGAGAVGQGAGQDRVE